MDYIVYSKDKQLFIPLEEVLQFFNIYFNKEENGNITGYINNSDSTFALDFREKYFIDIVQEKHTLLEDHLLEKNLSMYINIDLFSKIFHLETQSYFNLLTIYIYSKYQLPLQRLDNLNSIGIVKKTIDRNEEILPLISENKFNFLDGGIIDYNLKANTISNQQSYDYGLNLGLEVLGGEFLYNVVGTNSSQISNFRDNIFWRYKFNESWFNSLVLGNIPNIAVRNIGSRGFNRPFYNIRGIMLSNETSKIPNTFTNYIIEDRIEPNWIVQLYISDQLYESTNADLNGYFKFEIPITYGLTNIKLKYYGTRGEFIESEKIINIPSQMLIPGELKYTLAAGESVANKTKMIDGNVYLGITNWLTSSIFMNKVENSGNYSLINQSSINLYDKYMINITLTNLGVVELSTKLPISNSTNFDLAFTSFDKSITNSNFFGTFNFMGSFNNIFDLPISLSLMGSRNFGQNVNTNYLNANSSLFIRNTSLSLRYSIYFSDNFDGISYFNHSLNSNINYYFNGISEYIPFISGLSVFLATNINPTEWNFTNLMSGIQMQVSQDTYVSASYNYSPVSNTSNFSINMNMNLDFFRSTSGINLSSMTVPIFNQSLSGSMEFDSENLRLSFLNSFGTSSMNGKSSASIRIFNDKNYNGKYDEGDELSPDISFSVTNANIIKSSNEGNYLLSNLIPWNRYNVKINQDSYKNLPIYPVISEFSFIAEPYSYKSIDIPCHVGGTIEGTISRLKGDKILGQGGTIIYFESIDHKLKNEVSVFSDGSYYFSGLPVGKYNIYVDSLQLQILGCVSTPPIISFEVKKTVDGDYISNLNFTLIDNDSIAQIKKNIAMKSEKRRADIKRKFMDDQISEESNEPSLATSNSDKDIDMVYVDSLANNKVPREIETQSINDSIIPNNLHTFQYSNERTSLAPDMKRYLDRVADAMATNPNYELRIEGHSDSSGPIDENYKVSLKRAKEVVGYLVTKGVPKSRLISTAYGALRPIVENSSSKNKKINNRVELTLVVKN